MRGGGGAHQYFVEVRFLQDKVHGPSEVHGAAFHAPRDRRPVQPVALAHVDSRHGVHER